MIILYVHTNASKLAEITHREHYLVKRDCALCMCNLLAAKFKTSIFLKCIHRAKDFHCNSSQADRCGRVIRYILTSSKENSAWCCSIIALLNSKITRNYKVDFLKVQIFWEGEKYLKKHTKKHQIKLEDFLKFCGFLRKS